jgi:hypothetical protein
MGASVAIGSGISWFGAAACSAASPARMERISHRSALTLITLGLAACGCRADEAGNWHRPTGTLLFLGRVAPVLVFLIRLSSVGGTEAAVQSDHITLSKKVGKILFPVRYPSKEASSRVK